MSLNMSAFSIDTHVLNETERLAQFPIARQKIFLAHAAVTALPRCVADAIISYTRQSSENHQEFGDVLRDIQEAREISAKLIGANADEIALLGPTSLGLSLFANGLPWDAGDELLCYAGDYPANVYPWMNLQRRGVVVRYLEPERAGEITPELVERSLTAKTRLVALASAHFLTGYRIDIDAIGKLLHDRDILFSIDGIQTLGAFPTNVEHVDFLSADAHKWMLGPLAIGIVYVKKKHFDLLRPTLLGAWNVKSPNFITQEEIEFCETAQRYEPGVLNIIGIYGMRAAIEMLLAVGIDNVASRLLAHKAQLIKALEPLGFETVSPRDGSAASGITTFRHPRASLANLFQTLTENNVIVSMRHDRHNVEHLRFSPHFYNTEAEIDRAVQIIRDHV